MPAVDKIWPCSAPSSESEPRGNVGPEADAARQEARATSEWVRHVGMRAPRGKKAGYPSTACLSKSETSSAPPITSGTC